MGKKLYKSRRSKMIGGVAGGLGDYFDIDPVIIRVLFIMTAFAWGVSVIAYIILWIVLPENPDEVENFYDFVNDPNKDMNMDNYADIDDSKQKKDRKVIAGAFLIILGAVILLDKLNVWDSFSYIWPLILVAIGGYLIYKSVNKNNTEVS
ncbi:MAG: PspC domain-containing protein [Candidatus Kapabacteria bacterium]|nr:PspC domain-containing protein [Candidatus Kapabacteria bacterium]